MSKQYDDRDIFALDQAGNYYLRHVQAMTKEQLHTKSDIAAELAHRDMLADQRTAERDALAAQVEALRMAVLNAISFMSGGEAKAQLRDAYDATPQQHLAEIRAQAIDEFMNKATHEIANLYTSSTPVTPWESGMNSMLTMFATYTQKYMKQLCANRADSIRRGEVK